MRMLNWILASLACAVTWAASAQTNPVSATNIPKAAIGARAAKPPYPLAFDAEVKDFITKTQQLETHFTFNITNTSTTNVVITGTMSSCGCTVTTMPADPWVLTPGTNGQLQIEVNLAGKFGILNKQVMIMASGLPPKILTLRLDLPMPDEMTDEERARNAELAKADAQAIFKGSCATCHVTPSRGRMGADLYNTMCGVCHESPRRASMVANLHALKKPTNFEYWKTVITQGLTNSMMPSFSVSQGGPLSDARIDSIADYLNVSISRNRPRRSAAETLDAAKARQLPFTNQAPVTETLKVPAASPAATNAVVKPM